MLKTVSRAPNANIYSQQLQEASLWRKVRHVVLRFFGDIEFTVYSLLAPSIELTATQEGQLTKLQGAKLHVIKTFRRKTRLETSSIKEYLQYLKERTDNFDYIAEFMFPFSGRGKPSSVGSTDLFRRHSDKDELPKKIAIPVVLGGMRDHIVVFFVNKEKNTIDFYDPKGMTIRDRAKAKLVTDPNSNLEDVLNQIKKAAGLKNPIIYENTSKHQSDAHNCGVFVARFVALRLRSGVDITQIFADSATSAEANSTYRAHMIRQLLNHWVPQSQEANLPTMDPQTSNKPVLEEWSEEDFTD